MKSTPGMKHAVRDALIMQGVAMLAAVIMFWIVYSELDGTYGIEIATVLMVGFLGGSLVRAFVREDKGTVVFIIVVIAEAVLLYQCPQPWSGLWPVLIPGNAIGLMAGVGIRQVKTASKPKPRDVWIINGDEDPRRESAKAKSLSALYSWDAGDSGRFYVQRNETVFEAVGNPVTGFIVHCTPNAQDESAWRMIGADDGRDITEIRLLSGPAYAPRAILTDLDATRKALLGFFHHGAPDPEFPWSSGEDVWTFKFDEVPL